MVAFSSMLTRDDDQIRKSLDAAVFLAPATATLPASLTSGASGDLLALPTGYEDVGWLDKGDGVTEGRKVDSQEVESLGSARPTRRDIVKVDNTIKFVMQQTHRLSLELYHGVAVDPAGFDATSKEVSFAEPARPATIYYRCLVIWVDLSGTDSIYAATSYPRVSVTDMADKKLAEGGPPVQYDVTLTAYMDNTAGYASKPMFGGPGWITRLDGMGWS